MDHAQVDEIHRQVRAITKQGHVSDRESSVVEAQLKDIRTAALHRPDQVEDLTGQLMLDSNNICGSGGYANIWKGRRGNIEVGKIILSRCSEH
jgi:hypothetical protein